jgi:hypothetical protein
MIANQRLKAKQYPYLPSTAYRWQKRHLLLDAKPITPLFDAINDGRCGFLSVWRRHWMSRGIGNSLQEAFTSSFRAARLSKFTSISSLRNRWCCVAALL